MKLKDFEDCLNKMGLELINVSLSHGTVNHALAVRRLGKKKCEGYHWYFGCCRKSFKNLSYGEARENHSIIEAKAPNAWSPFPSFNISELEKKYLQQCTACH